MKRRSSRAPWILLSAALLAVALLIGLATVADYGASWDEQIRHDAGERKLDYYIHLLQGEFAEARQISARKDKYPGFYDLNLAILRRFSPFTDIVTGHAFSLLLGLAAVFGTIRLGSLLAGPRAGFLAGLVLLLTPSFYGHMFINPKDIPFACGYVWSVYWICRWLRAWPKVPWSTVMLTGLAVGIAVSTRVGGLVLVCYLGLFLLLAWLGGRAATEPHGRISLRPLLGQILPVAAAIGTAICLLALYWPSMHASPFGRTSETLEAVTQFSWTMPVLFAGNYHQAADLPWHYILQMLLLKIPLGILLLFMGGCAWVLTGASRTGCGLLHPSFLPAPLVLFSVFFPLAYVIVRDSTLYNGVRHLLFVVPPMAAIGGIALDRLLMFTAARSRSIRAASLAGVTAYAGLLVITIARLHPYQYIYYNELAGGVSGAAGRYETDYWGTVYKELVESLFQHLSTTHPTFEHPYVLINMEHVTWLAEPFLPAEAPLPIRLVRSNPAQDDFYMASTSWDAHQYYYGKTIIVVERMGIPLGAVKDRRGLQPPQRVLGYGHAGIEP